MQPIMTAAEVTAFLDREFPQMQRLGRIFEVVSIAPGEAEVRLDANEAHLRPGGTVSGPTLFSLADVGAYVVVLAHIGPVALAVTSHVSINFLSKPPPGPLIAHCRILRLGKRTAVTEIGIAAEGSEELVAHATATYAIPSKVP
jgi:uncharacterized protein (TIGR00369 family)